MDKNLAARSFASKRCPEASRTTFLLPENELRHKKPFCRFQNSRCDRIPGIFEVAIRFVISMGNLLVAIGTAESVGGNHNYKKLLIDYIGPNFRSNFHQQR